MVVENINLFSSQSKSFGDFVRTYSDEGIYIPNEFQRDYGWTNIQVEQLIEDILEAFEQGKYLMLNRIAVSRIGDSEFIIDGQQRITTLFIIYNRVSRYLNPRGEDSFLMKDSFGGEADNGVILSNSSADHPNKEVFENIIIHNSIGDKTNPLNRCALLVDNSIKNMKLSEKSAGMLLRFIDKRVYFGVDFLPEEYSISYYDDINSKGLKLDSVDKVKTYLGSLINNHARFSELWMEFLNTMDNLNTVGFRTRTSSTVQEFVIDCALRTFKERDSRGKIIGKSFSQKSVREIETFIRTNVTNQSTAENLIRHSIYVGKRIAYYLTDCVENVVFRHFGKNTSAHFTSFILSEMGGIELSVTSHIIEKVWLTHSNSGGGKKKTDNSVKPINNILLSGGTEQQISEWFEKESKSRLRPFFDIENLMEETTYETPSGRRTIKNFLLYTEAYLRSEYFKTNFHKEFKNLVDRKGNNSVTLEHIVPQKDFSEEINYLGNITLLSKTDNSRLKEDTERKFNVYSNSDFLINKVMLESKDLFNNRFTKEHVLPYFTQYNETDLKYFKENITERQSNLINYIEKEVFGI